MFIDNKYTKWYINLINRAKTRSTLKESESIYEIHHIIPKCCKGTNQKDNLIKLTAKEHFIAHLLLTKMVYDKNLQIRLSWALHRMIFSNLGTSRLYSHYRKMWSNFQKNNHHAHRENNHNYRKKLSDIVSKHWQNDDERKANTSLRMKTYMNKMKKDDPELFYQRQKKYAKLGGQASKLKKTLNIEYKQNVYFGWQELLKCTGITKHLYKKYYLNGQDPEHRIGANGPIPNAGASSSEGEKSDD